MDSYSNGCFPFQESKQVASPDRVSGQGAGAMHVTQGAIFAKPYLNLDFPPRCIILSQLLRKLLFRLTVSGNIVQLFI